MYKLRIVYETYLLTDLPIHLLLTLYFYKVVYLKGLRVREN